MYFLPEPVWERWNSIKRWQYIKKRTQENLASHLRLRGQHLAEVRAVEAKKEVLYFLM
jgi:hypothetical protein